MNKKPNQSVELRLPAARKAVAHRVVREMKIVPILALLLVLIGCSIKAPAPSPGYKYPSEESITIYGSLEQGLNIQFYVTYVTTSPEKGCQEYISAAGIWDSQDKTFEYTPRILEGNRYRITIPLREIDPNTECRWRPLRISLGVWSDKEEDLYPVRTGLFDLMNESARNTNEQNLYYVQNGFWKSSADEGVEVFFDKSKDYTVNIYSNKAVE